MTDCGRVGCPTAMISVMESMTDCGRVGCPTAMISVMESMTDCGRAGCPIAMIPVISTEACVGWMLTALAACIVSHRWICFDNFICGHTWREWYHSLNGQSEE